MAEVAKVHFLNGNSITLEVVLQNIKEAIDGKDYGNNLIIEEDLIEFSHYLSEEIVLDEDEVDLVRKVTFDLVNSLANTRDPYMLGLGVNLCITLNEFAPSDLEMLLTMVDEVIVSKASIREWFL